MQYRKIFTTMFATTLAVGCLSYFQPSCFAFTPVTEITDINDTHWAYKSIEALIEKYQIMEGFPDKTFRGAKTLTRYELAAALYKVMTKVDEMLEDVGDDEMKKLLPTLQDDLKAIAALQLEFKKELTEIKGTNTKLEERILKLEKVKFSGEVQVRYRDRIAVTDDTQYASPLFSGTSVNGNNLGDSATGVYNSPNGNYITKNDSLPLRVKTSLNLDVDFSPDISYVGKFTAFESGNGSLASGHFGDEGLGAPLYVEKSFLKLGAKWGGEENELPGELCFRVGLLNFSDSANTGTKLYNHFSDQTWIGHGYGLVGWGGHELFTKKWDPSTNAFLDYYKNSVSRFWVGDINVSRVDPDSALYNNVPAPGFSFNTNLGILKFMVGANNGSMYTNRQYAAQGNLSGLTGTEVTRGDAYPYTISDTNIDNVVGHAYYTDKTKVIGSAIDNDSRIPSNLLDLPSEANDGYGIVGIDVEMGENIGNTAFPVRAALYARNFWNDTTFVLGGSRKEISGVLDLGWDENFGMTLQVDSSALGYDMASLGLFFNNINGSGLDIGLGSKFAFRNLLSSFDATKVAASNAGLYIVFPSFDNAVPRLMIAARQSFSDSFGTKTIEDTAGNIVNPYPLFKDSGLTVSLPFRKMGGLDWDLVFEYNTLIEGALWSANFLAHDLGVYSIYRF